MSRISPKRKDSKSSNPSGHITKPPKEYAKPIHLDDDTRVVHAEEPNRKDG